MSFSAPPNKTYAKVEYDPVKEAIQNSTTLKVGGGGYAVSHGTRFAKSALMSLMERRAPIEDFQKLMKSKEFIVGYDGLNTLNNLEHAHLKGTDPAAYAQKFQSLRKDGTAAIYDSAMGSVIEEKVIPIVYPQPSAGSSFLDPILNLTSDLISDETKNNIRNAMNMGLRESIAIPFSEESRTSYTVLRRMSDGSVSISIQGTHLPIEKYHLGVGTLKSDFVPYSYGEFEGNIFSGFEQMYTGTRSQFLNGLKELIGEVPATQINLTGHSLGGAFAQMLSADKDFPNVTRNIITVGSPAVGDSKFNLNLSNSQVRLSRIVHEADPIPFSTGGEHVSSIRYAVNDIGLRAPSIESHLMRSYTGELTSHMENPALYTVGDMSSTAYSARAMNAMSRFINEGPIRDVADGYVIGQQLVQHASMDLSDQVRVMANQTRQTASELLGDLRTRMQARLQSWFPITENNSAVYTQLGRMDSLLVENGLFPGTPLAVSESTPLLSRVWNEAAASVRPLINTPQSLDVGYLQTLEQNFPDDYVNFVGQIPHAELRTALMSGSMDLTSPSFLRQAGQLFQTADTSWVDTASERLLNPSYSVGLPKVAAPSVGIAMSGTSTYYDIPLTPKTITYVDGAGAVVQRTFTNTEMPTGALGAIASTAGREASVLTSTARAFGNTFGRGGDVVTSMISKAGTALNTANSALNDAMFSVGGVGRVIGDAGRGAVQYAFPGAANLGRSVFNKAATGVSRYVSNITSAVSEAAEGTSTVATIARGAGIVLGGVAAGAKAVAETVAKYSGVLAGAGFSYQLFNDITLNHETEAHIDWNNERVYKLYDPDLFNYISMMKTIYVKLQNLYPPKFSSNDFCNIYFGRISQDSTGHMRIDDKPAEEYNPAADPKLINAPSYYYGGDNTHSNQTSDWTVFFKDLGLNLAQLALSADPLTLPLAIGLGVANDVVKQTGMDFDKGGGQRAMMKMGAGPIEDHYVKDFLSSRGITDPTAEVLNLVKRLVRDTEGIDDDDERGHQAIDGQLLAAIPVAEMKKILDPEHFDAYLKVLRRGDADMSFNHFLEIVEGKQRTQDQKDQDAEQHMNVNVFGVATNVIRDWISGVKMDNLRDNIKRDTNVLQSDPTYYLTHDTPWEAATKEITVLQQIVQMAQLQESRQKLLSEIQELLPGVQPSFAGLSDEEAASKAKNGWADGSHPNFTYKGEDVTDAVYSAVYYHDKYSPQGYTVQLDNAHGLRIMKDTQDITNVIQLEDYIDRTYPDLKVHLDLTTPTPGIQIYRVSEGVPYLENKGDYQDMLNTISALPNTNPVDADVSNFFLYDYLRKTYEPLGDYRIEMQAGVGVTVMYGQPTLPRISL